MLNSRDSTRCGCTPRIGNVADPVDIARAGVPCQPMWAGQFALVGSTTYCRLTAMTRAHFAEGQVLFREGDPADGVFRLLSGTVDILRELDGAPILLGTVGSGQFIGEMGVVENRPRSATARAASEIEAEILTPTEFFDQIAGSPRAARELIQRLSQRLREADDRIVSDERRSGRVHGTRKDADGQTTVDVESVNNAYLAA